MDKLEFEMDVILDYLREITDYSASKGMKNVVGIIPNLFGITMDDLPRFCELPHMDNVGSDPYCVGMKEADFDFSVYKYVYEKTKETLNASNRYQKESNIWLQAHGNPAGFEEDIVVTAEAAYDAGARTIIAWGYYGSDSADYRSSHPAVAWARTCDAMQRLRNHERDRILAENRKLYASVDEEKL